MNNDFRNNGILRVRCLSANERSLLLETAGSLGILIPEQMKRNTRFCSTDVNTYEINIQEMTIETIGSPSIGAAMCSSGVRFYSVAEFCRLAELEFEYMPRFPLFHVPHDGWKFPIKLLASTCIPREEFERYHEIMRDTGVSRLIPDPYRYQSTMGKFEISRLLCDVERFIGPEEVMERYGMGFCYEKAYDGTVIKNISSALKTRTFRYYQEHHKRMDALCERHPSVLLFDMHSYSDEIVPQDFLVPGIETPDVCIGTDARFTPQMLSFIVSKRFEEAGFTTAENYPYSGCYIPNSARTGKSDCFSVMLEFNKRTYLDKDGNVDEDKAGSIRDAIRKIIVDCVPLGDWKQKKEVIWATMKMSSVRRP